jgi:hypothetical protein
MLRHKPIRLLDKTHSFVSTDIGSFGPLRHIARSLGEHRIIQSSLAKLFFEHAHSLVIT